MGRRLAGWFLVIAFGAAAAASLSPAFVEDAAAGDPKIADSLFKSGKQALGKGDAEGAISFFKKAFEENPDLIEACWWRGSAQEKAGDKAGALASYREYATLFDGKPVASKEEQRLKALADKSIAQLGAGDGELKKLEDGYIASLLAFAKNYFVRDPSVSRRALEAILAARPDHEEAMNLLEKLGGAAPGADETAAAPKNAAGPAPGPFAKIKEWSDLLAKQAIRAEKIQYEDGLMVVDTRNGAKITPNSAIDMGESYALEMEYHVQEVYERGWFTSLVFGDREDETYMATLAMSGRIVLLRVLSGTQTEAASYDMPPVDLEKWHRLGVIVKGAQCEVWFDGKKVLTWREPAGADLTGSMGLFQQRCRTEWRLFRTGKAE